MLARLKLSARPFEAALARSLHALALAPADTPLAQWPLADQLHATLKRRRMKLEDLAKSHVTVPTAAGGLCVFAALDRAKPRFEQLTQLRKAVASLFEERPRGLSLGVFGDEALRVALAREALYVAWVNGALLPARKSKDAAAPLERVEVHGAGAGTHEFDDVAALARANVLARELSALPPNELTPEFYRKRVKQHARSMGWEWEEFTARALARMGAGAFCAVARGSASDEAAIVRMTYKPRDALLKVALVGKGICFDTGGHNLKGARGMHGMHEDMNGSAVVLSLLQALAEQRFPVEIEAWLAIARNQLSPQAYTQNEVVTALNGTTIEVVHTDAEGRMVLADTLTLAAQRAPHLIVDFATLTGSMITALGTRHAGVFASDTQLGRLALEAGQASGERVTLFPADADYDEALESKVADIKQCTLEGEADHILATRFLSRFAGDAPWLHVDLSSANAKGGLGAVGSDLTGFGVAWGVELLRRWLAERPAPMTRLARRRR